MNGSAKRLMAVMLASVMIASAMVVVLVDEQDSSAEADTDYYYNQLDMDFTKSVYNAVATIPNFESLTITINSISAADKATMTANESDKYYLSGLINKGIIAAIYDNPLIGFYINSTNPTTDKITHTSGYASVTFTLNKVDPTTPGKSLSTYKDEMNTAITAFSDTVTSDPVSTKITKIHNHVADSLTYYSSGDATVIRSVYTSLCGDHKVVCEGYAKMFKVLCDACDVPCLIVTGKAGTDDDKENHMWNYVQVDDKWYLVDCTWDDQQDGPMGTIVDDYLMAGTGTVGFESKTVGETYDPSGLDTGLVADKTLSYYSYGDDRPQYLVTFLYDPELDPEKVYKTQYVGKDATVFLPTDPADDIGHHFLGWYQHGSDTEYDFSTPVTGPLTIDGKWTSTDVYTLKYETDGGTVIQATRVESTDNTTKITNTEPKKEGYKFIEWNTAKNGGGISYKGGEDITLVGDCTLYAIWEDTSSVTFKIDNVVAQAAEFLSKESIPGVSNFLLTIGVITTVVSLIAVIAIARK